MIPLLIAGGAALAGAIANVIGSANASAAQQHAAQEALDLQANQYAQSRQDMAPYLQGGQATFAQLLQQMQSGGFNTSVDPSQIANDPGFAFRMQQGQQALERSAAAKGGLMSGGFAKSLTNYSQGLASNEFQNAFARNQSENQARFGRMMGVAGLGQSAAGMLGATGQNYANSASNLFGAMGNAQAAGSIGASNAVSNAAGQIGGMAMMAGGNPMGGMSMMQSGGGGSTGYASGYQMPGGFGLNQLAASPGYAGYTNGGIPTQRGFGGLYGGGY